MKDLSAKAKWKNMRIFHVQLLFHAATESHSNYCAANNNVPTTVAPFNSAGECIFSEKPRNRILLKKNKH